MSSENKLIRQRSEPMPEHLKIFEECYKEDVESSSLDGKRITLSFQVTNQNDDHFSRSFKHWYTIGDVKRKLSKLLKTPADNLIIIKEDCALADEVRITILALDKDERAAVEIFTRDDSFIDVDVVKEKFNESISVIVQDEPPKKIIPANVTCKFHVVNQNHFFTQMFSSSTSIAELKEKLSLILGVDRDMLMPVKNKSIINDNTQLFELEIDNFGNLELDLFTKDGTKMKFDTVYKDVPIADILTVAIPIGNNKIVNINVEVIDAKIIKPYLGGYRNKISGLEYHHAFSQTQDFRSKLPANMKNHRDTQTMNFKERSMGTVTNRATQIQMPGSYFPHLSDVILVARPFNSRFSVPRETLPLDVYAIRIQRAWRTHRIRKAVGRWLNQCRRRIQDMKNEELEEIRIRDLRLQKEMKAKTFPRTREDFDQLYAMVDRWRNTEIARISKLHSKGPKVAEFSSLLDKEVQLLRSIEKFRIELTEDNRKIKENQLLEEMSNPITWKNAKGNLITMDTVEAQQARKFKELYEKFSGDNLKIEERLELLINFKYALKNYKSSLAEQLTALIDRECELLIRNVPTKDLEILRKRIKSTLFQFIKKYGFNEETVKRHKMKKIKNMENGRLYYCHYCDRVKMYTEFSLHSRTQDLKVCTACVWSSFADQNWVDMTPYKFMLRSLRREEKRNSCYSSIAFIIQEKDIHFIVDKIWHSRSAISESNDLIDLRLCRWNVQEVWSPWNCVLLTFREMKSHLKLIQAEEAYDGDLVKRVKNKHMLAKIHFKQLKHIVQYIREDDLITGDGDMS